MHCNQILKLIKTLLWITNLDAPIKVAFEKEPYKVINWKFSGESQIFQLFALSSFLFLSSLEKRNRNALVLIVSWKFQDLNYSKVFIFCPFDSSLVAACYECFFLRWYCIAQDISPYNCIQIGGCRMHFAVLIWYSMHATDTGANVSIISLGGHLPTKVFSET